jgi:predicted pyridoxine 5'-phosphate oxidase superfamily flavin-nucleotide-binding protein
MSDIAFTETVKAAQSRRGSRAAYAKLEAKGGFHTKVTAELVAFLAEVDTTYLATANSAGQPYIQHRGGPKGFVRVLDETTLGFVDFAGNRQYITLGNLVENDQAFLFLMDYTHRRRVKVWGRARVIESDPELISRLMPEHYPARPEQVILLEVKAWDTNCSQHIPQKLNPTEVAGLLSELRGRVELLENENERLRAAIRAASPENRS